MPETILVVDDDPDIARFVEVNLRSAGYDVSVASDGEQALEKAAALRPDLVLLDVMMPRIDGFEVAQRLRRNPQTASTSIIMLTAKALSTDKVLGLTAGADDYIIKPFDPIELLARVKGTLRRAKEMRNLSPLTGLPGNIRIQEEIERRKGEMQKLPLAGVSVGIATTEVRKFEHYGEAVAVATEMKQFAKREPRSWYAIDRRKI